MKVAFYASHHDPVPTVEDLDWSALASRLKSFRVSACAKSPCLGKCPAKNGPAWAPHEVTERRANENVRAITVAVFDLDHQRPEELDVLEALESSGQAYLIHSTHSHQPPSNYSFRLAFPLSRSVTPAEWPAVRNAIARKFGLRFDDAAKDPARLYYLPTTQPGVEYVYDAADGAPLDVEDLLAAARTGTVSNAPSPVSGPSTGTELNAIRPTDMHELARELLRRASPESKGLIRKHLNGEKLPAGEHDAATNRLMAVCGFVLPDETPADAILELFRPCFTASTVDCTNDVEHHLKEARDMLERARARRRSVDEKRAAANAERWAQLGVDTSKVAPTPIEEGTEEDPDAWGTRLITFETKDGVRLRNCEANIHTVLKYSPEWRGALKFNEVTKELVCEGGPLKSTNADGLDTDIAVWLQQSKYGQLGLMAKPGNVRDVMRQVAMSNGFDPLRAWLDGLVWDGVERLDTFLVRYFGAVGDPQYLRGISPKWLVSGVARALRPGCKVDTMVVLEGPQGLKKSTALRALFGEWFCDAPFDLAHKDSWALAGQNWGIEFAEVQTFKRASDVEALKACLSRSEDTFRPPYGRVNAKFPRRCIFVGTTNADDYLKTDPSGYRRFWTVQCTAIDIDALRHDQPQLWAEAVVRYHRGESWWLEEAEARLAEKYAKSRVDVSDDSRRETIRKWLLGKPAAERPSEVTIVQVAADAFGLTPAQVDKRISNEISAGLYALGCERRQLSRYGGTRSYHFPDELLNAPQEARGFVPRSTPPRVEATA